MSETMKKKIDNLEKNVRLAKTSLYSEPFVIDEAEIEKLQLNELTKIKVNPTTEQTSKDVKPAATQKK